MGSKNRIAKYIKPIITRYLTPDRWYVEPFCGGCNMIDKINHPKRIANDSNRYLIALFKELQNGREFPEYVSEEEYKRVRDNKGNYPDWYVGYVGFALSFRGKFFAGYNGGGRYAIQARANTMAQSRRLVGVEFRCQSYDDLAIPEGAIVYCDPPYGGTTGYKDSFDNEQFWRWARALTKDKNDVLISEYNAPSDFFCIWRCALAMNLGGDAKRAVEKLFVHESIAERYITRELFDYDAKG